MVEGIGPKIEGLLQEGGINYLGRAWQMLLLKKFRLSSMQLVLVTACTTLKPGQSKQALAH
jgi:hypothetical protein